MEVTAANAADMTVAAGLICEEDEVVYADAAYQGIEDHEEIKENRVALEVQG
jgi:IS5 family transposase